LGKIVEIEVSQGKKMDRQLVQVGIGHNRIVIIDKNIISLPYSTFF
jgi:hypothetical protein